ncbi:L type [Durusdinium trenchii]|uniref:L type n=1 Tax=Durusdinium trenchii TaxID=1381693 RepID=A0ABP0KF16_9DINO
MEVSSSSLPSGREASHGSSRRNQMLHVAGSFLHSDHEIKAASAIAKLKEFMNSAYLANFMAVVVLVDAYCTCRDIDATAAQEQAPEILNIISDLCLAIYSLEVLGWLGLFGIGILRDFMILLDLFIVMCGWVEKIVDSIEGHGLGFNIAMLRALRLVRIFRLMRLLKRVRPLRELHKLVMMMATCFRTLIWSFLLCFVVMTVWAMLLVEVVHPALQDMNESAKFVCNKQCLAAVSSVMHANLLLFKTVIAGDGWGEIAVPVIHEHPGTAFIFVGSLLTLVFGVLNLIVAVVVDTFADARLNDVQNLAEEMEDEIEHDRKALAKLFAKIDKDGSGQLTLSEMIEGARHDPTFQSRLRVMDIDEHDLEQLFQMIDHDQSGTIEVAEFIGPLSRWAHDSKTAPRFIKYNMIQTMHLQEDLYELSSECFNQLAARIDDLALQMQELKAPWSTETRRSLRRSVKGEETEKARPTEGLEEVFSDLGADSGSEVDDQVHPPAKHGLDQPLPSKSDIHFLSPKSAEREARETSSLVEFMLETAVFKLETKLDALLDHCRLRAKPLSVSPEHSSADKNSEDWPGTVDRKPKRRARGLHPEAFRHMYMERNGKRHATDEVSASRSISEKRLSTRSGVPLPTRRRSLSSEGLPTNPLVSPDLCPYPMEQ